MLRQWKTTIPELPVRNGKPLYTQIGDVLISEIISGRFRPGTVLPGSRELAKNLNKSRQTVLQALDNLIDQGWLYTLPKKGTFVAQKDKWPVPGSQPAATQQAPEPAFSYHQFTTGLSLLKAESKPGQVQFDDGFADLKLSPVKELMTASRSLYEQHLRIKKTESFFVDGPEQLRHEVNLMLKLHRGIKMNEANSCFVRGNQLTFFLSAYVLLRRGDTVVTENPGNLFAWDIFKHTGASILTVPVDEQGILTDELERLCQKQKVNAVYVTPQCQYPTTVILSEQRRIHLIELAARYGFAIIESDFEHEFWFNEKPVLPLAANYPEHVVYIGSLSRMLNPLMRIGFITGPEGFINSVKALAASIDSCGDFVLEKTVASLMAAGVINRYIRKSAAIYRERRDRMAHLLKSHLGNNVSFQPPPGGLAYWLQFHTGFTMSSIIEKLRQFHVSIPPLCLYHFTSDSIKRYPGARIGFGSVSEEEMDKGLQMLKLAIT